MRIANPFIMIAHVIASLREADVGQQSADTIKFDFRFRCPRALGTKSTSGTRPESGGHLRRGKRQTAGNGVAAIQTEPLPKIRSNVRFGVIREHWTASEMGSLSNIGRELIPSVYRRRSDQHAAGLGAPGASPVRPAGLPREGRPRGAGGRPRACSVGW
jgi:hypothetical protein